MLNYILLDMLFQEMEQPLVTRRDESRISLRNADGRRQV